MHLSRLGNEMVANARGADKTGGHIQGQCGLAVRIARRGKGNITQAEQQATMGHVVKIEHRCGHHQRDPTVPWFDGLDGSTQPVGKGILADMGRAIAGLIISGVSGSWGCKGGQSRICTRALRKSVSGLQRDAPFFQAGMAGNERRPAPATGDSGGAMFCGNPVVSLPPSRWRAAIIGCGLKCPPIRPARRQQFVEADVHHDTGDAAKEYAHHLGGNSTVVTAPEEKKGTVTDDRPRSSANPLSITPAEKPVAIERKR